MEFTFLYGKPGQGTLTERKVSVQLTSLRYLVKISNFNNQIIILPLLQNKLA